MPQMQNYTNIIDMFADRTHSNDDRSSKSRYQDTGSILRRYSRCIEEIRQGCAEEIRQQQVYEALKQDVAEWIQIGAGLESDALGFPQISMNYLVGNQNNATSTHSPPETACSEDHQPLDTRFTRSNILSSSDNYIANEATLLTPNECSTSYRYNNISYSCEKDCRQPQAFNGDPPSPTYEDKGVVFWHIPTDEDVRQARHSRNQSTMNPISPATPTSVHCSQPAQDHQKTYNDCLLRDLDEFVASQFNPESNSIRDIGCATFKAVIEDDRSERAYVSSQIGEISDISTPALMQDDEGDEYNGMKQEESESEISPLAITIGASTNAHAISIGQDDGTIAHSTAATSDYEENQQIAITGNQDDEPYTFYDLENLKNGISTPQDGWNTANRGPILCSDSQPAFHPDFDVPNPDIPDFMRSLHSLSKTNQAIQNLSEPRHLSQLTLGQPKNSSIIKRRTKRSTCRTSRPSQQFLSATTYRRTPTPDIASFFRANSRYKYLDFIKPLPPVQISKKPTYTDLPRVKKRSARESFDLIELCYENIDRQRSRKKPRLDSTPTTPKSTHLPPTPKSTVSSYFHSSPMATALKGYPGQFGIHRPRTASEPTESAPDTKHVFGNHLHANGEIINLKFIPDSSLNKLDLSDLTDISSTLEHANLHHTFAEEILRSHEEEELRKEAYRECAAARLEGVPVGFYRYFAGHMTVEEYNEARMCVCWKGCWCTKMCTHFGDLACPCAEHLIVGQEI